jgi:acetate kinase
VRELAADGLGFLGLAIDARRNDEAVDDADISDSAAPARTLVITAREDLEIARQARAVLGGAAGAVSGD